MTLGRQIAAVIVGIVFSYLAGAACGYFLYRISGQWPHAVPVLARYVLNPVIALLTGALVGALAKYRPALLAALSLVRFEFIPLLDRRPDGAHLLFMAFLAVISLLLGGAAAKATFRMRGRRLASGLART
jgi:hypothetical protein